MNDVSDINHRKKLYNLALNMFRILAFCDGEVVPFAIPISGKRQLSPFRKDSRQFGACAPVLHLISGIYLNQTIGRPWLSVAMMVERDIVHRVFELIKKNCESWASINS